MAAGSLLPDFEAERDEIEHVLRLLGEALATCNGEITGISEDFTGLADALACSDLMQASRDLASVAQGSNELAVMELREAKVLADLAAMDREGRLSLDNVTRSIQIAEMLVVNARVVAASILGAEEDMTVFSSDLAELANQMTRGANALGVQAGELSRSINAALLAHRQFQHSEGDRLATTIKLLQTDIARLETGRDTSAQAASEIPSILVDLRAAIAEAVPLLQIGDATRQRLEHVAAIVQASTGDTTSNHQLLTLAKALLHHARLELSQDTLKAADSIDRLVGRVGELLARSTSHIDRIGDSSIGTISRSVASAIDVLLNCAVSLDHSRQLAGDVNLSIEALNRLLIHLDDMGFRAHIVSLNATIRCAILGDEGDGLKVVSVQLRENFDSIVMHSKVVFEKYNAVSAAVTQLDHRQTDTKKPTFQDHARICQRALGDFAELASLSDRLMQAQPGRVRKIEKALMDAQLAISCLQDISRQVDHVQTELGQQLALPATDTSTPPQEIIANLRALLTMQSERIVFDQVLETRDRLAA